MLEIYEQVDQLQIGPLSKQKNVLFYIFGPHELSRNIFVFLSLWCIPGMQMVISNQIIM